MHVGYVFYRIFQQPGPIGIQVHPGIRESFLHGLDDFHFFIPGQYAAFQLEILEPVFFLSCPAQGHDAVRIQGFFIPQPVPFTVRIFLMVIGQIRLVSVPYEEQIT